MNWKVIAAEDLKEYPAMLIAQENIKDELAELDACLYSVRSSIASAVPMHGGGNHYEDKLINNIVKQKRLSLNDKYNENKVQMIERGLSVLSKTEKRVLEKFYMYRTSKYIDELMDELFIERSRVYQIKDAALYKFTIAMYGLTDS